VNSLKTYSHLDSARKIPSDYEVASTDLLYYLRRGFEVETPVMDWYKTYQQKSPLKCSDWERFSDPRATTYSSYVTLQNQKEIFTSQLFDTVGAGGKESLPPHWKGEVLHTAGCLRFLFHGLQMVAAYVGQMAPSSKITIVCAFQAADELRRVNHFSYKLAMAGGLQAQDEVKRIWMADPAWQPLRRLVEELLVVYDWGEAFAALNLAVKPKIDVLLEKFRAFAKANDRHSFAEIIGSQLEDSKWHMTWSQALKEVLIKDNRENETILARWVQNWEEKAAGAVNDVVNGWTLKESHEHSSIDAN